jgi:phosphoglycerate dehydrogenase-like enzyme
MVAAVTGSIALTAPPGVELRRVAHDPLDRAALDGVEFLVPDAGGDEVLRALAELRELRVVQVLSAGTDWIERYVPPWAALCNARGARDAAVAEWVAGALLGATSGLLEGAREHTWGERSPGELAGSTVLVLGYGSIGAAVRARLEPFGVELVPVGRSRLAELPELLPRTDAVVVLAPLTDATRGMVDAAFLARMRDGALLVNAGRGAVVDTDALLAELQTGRLRAVLDVVDPEPLPAGHPLWRAPGTLAITPHHAGDTLQADARAVALACEQLARYARGDELRNVVLPAGR